MILNKKASIVTICIILGSLLTVVSVGLGWVERTDVYVSDSSDLWWSGAQANVHNTSGYIVPDLEVEWSPAIYTWEHPNWWDYLEANDFQENGADWIWKSYRLSKEDKAEGDIVFFTKEFDIPLDTEISSAELTVTVDNGYYFYVNNPTWEGDPIASSGFAPGYDETNFYTSIDGILRPSEDSVPPDMTTWSTIETYDLTDIVVPGSNVLQIVAINHNPPPKSHHQSSNRAGLIYKLEVTYDAPLTVPAGFMIPLVNVPPADLDSIPTFEIKPIQAAWDPDINNDGRLDMVMGKNMAVVLNTSGAASPVLSFSVTFDGVIYSTSDNSDEIFTIYPIVPQTSGPFTITGSYTDGTGSHGLTAVDITVKETAPLYVTYSYLYKATVRKGKITGYTDYKFVDEADFDTMASMTTDFINSTYPVADIIVDDTYTGVAGVSSSRRDPFGALLDDALAVAQDAQWRLGGSAFGVGIAPNNTIYDADPGTDASEDYFDYHGFPGAAGISFGPSVRGVIALDGYYTGPPHEIAHSMGVYWGEPEQYQLYPPIGMAVSGVDTLNGNWRAGTGFMGAGPYRSLADSWVSTHTYEALFNQTALIPLDPEILLSSGIIYENGTVAFNQMIRLADGYPDIIEPGDYSLAYLDVGMIEISSTPFIADFGYFISPRIGTTNSTDEFGHFDADFAAFAFATEFEPTAKWIAIYNNTEGLNQLLGLYDTDDLVFFDSWVTNSLFEPIDGISVNFKKDKGTYTMQNANPGSLMYNVVVDTNGETSVQIVMSNVTAPDQEFTPAFDLHSGSPIRVYSDMGRTVDVTDTVIWVQNDHIVTVNMTIPDDEIRYIRVHLDFAPEGTTGYSKQEADNYYEELPFYVRFLNVATGFTLDQTDPFVAVGSE
jgi:hypothetical protein